MNSCEKAKNYLLLIPAIVVVLIFVFCKLKIPLFCKINSQGTGGDFILQIS